MVEASQRLLGHEHSDTLTSMANLATTYSNQGRLTEADELRSKLEAIVAGKINHAL